ncbi:hypothetical protein PFICI_13377 [Pestalotiopsis fici W106-1]|uniref:DNA replication factor Cdt1 C-terminal domain-containing protein n=1 Tax=Pestalotiopsis fici (strain W106-1 / CGMCC3.15140) TaxID=1229662 RepID=W3WLZ9_PESFW|nr:uncharacterized protein PFICI_13377 [Pestalotiopsis fici W106-1]ETS74893.1 hypothetical protein PFICI_13377 [Pestalotiopsis fici W106-1]
MPAAVKRQRPAVKSRLVVAKQEEGTTMNRFTRVSKSIQSTEEKTDVISKHAVTTSSETKASTSTPSRKRKAVKAIVDDSDSSADEAPRTAAPSSTRKTSERDILPAKRGRGRPPKKSKPAPVSLKRGRSLSVSESEQSSTDKLFKRLRLESSPSRDSSPVTAATSIADSEADSELESSPAPKLPVEVLDLIELHAALLKTLTIHYAHNGSHVPADLRILCPNVSRAWGKKAVTDVDIRTCLGILNLKTMKPLFSLSDYGRGKVCIELDQSQTSGLLVESELNHKFRANIQSLWSQSQFNKHRSIPTSFIQSLPQASIALCESVTKACAVTAKGKQRLDDLKQGIAAKKLEKEAKIAPKSLSASSPSSLTNPDGSKMSLLDRIRFKQMQKAALPAGLSPAELERHAAFQRVDEVTALIGMLSRASSGGMGRISFTMPVMLQKLKDSFRMGISKEEGAICIRLIAKEVAPTWIKVVTISGKENVVVETDQQLSKAEIAKRVQNLTVKN